MKEIKADIFSFLDDEETDVICITTNGMVGADGKAIMGAGTAGEAARRWPQIRSLLGAFLKKIGNKPAPIGLINNDGNYEPNYMAKIPNNDFKCLIISFPTKHDFRKPADLNLIIESAKSLAQFVNNSPFKKIIIPAPGCGAKTGQLDWETQVKPAIKDILDDRFIISFLE